MPTIFETLEAAHKDILNTFSVYDVVDEGHSYSWPNYVFSSSAFRRAHLDIVDARETKKLYMLHLTVMPHVHDPAPIFGFDIIAGPNKVTGAFHDFSPVSPQHALLDKFSAEVSQHQWSKPRELPDWAKAIFSDKMVAAGNIQTGEELSSLMQLVMGNLSMYLAGIGAASETDFTAAQNRYCYYQKHNPHTPKVMAALGLDPTEVARFIDTCLFPELVVR
jgi:hypothetical protein